MLDDVEVSDVSSGSPLLLFPDVELRELLLLELVGKPNYVGQTDSRAIRETELRKRRRLDGTFQCQSRTHQLSCLRK